MSFESPVSHNHHTPDNNPVEINETSLTRPKRRIKWRSFVPLGVAAAIVGAALIPLPYVVQSPGPTVDVLGFHQETPLIEVPLEKATDETSGQLRMVTVSAYGSPENWISGFQYLQAKLTAGYDIVPLETYYPENITAEELNEYNLKAMVSSQSTAAAAAFNELGIHVPAQVTILGAVSGSPLEGKVEKDDILKAVEIEGKRIEINTAAVTFELTRDLPEGTPLVFEVERKGEIQRINTKSYRPAGLTEFDTGSRFGIYLRVDAQLPAEVKIHLEDIGGPSAGMIFALAVIDKLRGGQLLGEHVVAGTGAINYDGVVEPIGGIVQKMYGAKRDKAQWFLAPVQNCDEVVGNIPAGLEVWPVHTLKDALGALEAIKTGKTETHPTCADFVK